MKLMQRYEYDAIIEKIQSCIFYYDNVNFSNNSYFMCLANGDALNIKIPRSQLAHLLGVNIDYLKAKGKLKNNTNTYEALIEFLDKSFSIYNGISTGELDPYMMFSKNINEKLECFIDNTRIRTDDMEYVIKYDSEKTYKSEEHAEICEYYIVRKVDNKYMILGLVKSDINEKIYLPVTSRCYKDYYEFNDFAERIAKKQEITYCYLLNIKNNITQFDKNFNLVFDDRYALLDKLITVSKKLDATVSVAKDLLHSLSLSKDKMTDRSIDFKALNYIVECMRKSVVVDMEGITFEDGEISYSVRELVNVYNDFICNGYQVNESVSVSYSKISEENKALKEELESYKAILEKVKKENADLNKKNSELEEGLAKAELELSIYEEAHAKVLALRA